MEQFFFSASLEGVIEFEVVVEVVFHGAFAATGNDDDVLDSGSDGFFNAVLNDGLVDERQHLFGDYLGGGQETSSETTCGEDNFANFLFHYGSVNHSALLFSNVCRAEDLNSF